MKRALFVVAGIAFAALLGTWAYTSRHLENPMPPAAAPEAAAPQAEPASEPLPAIRYPLASAPSPAAPASSSADIDTALAELFGLKAVLAMFQLGDLPRRFVATVDNLGRQQAPAGRWPLTPAAGRFMVQTQNGVSVIDPDNGSRYAPYVLLLEQVDMQQLSAAYVRHYAMFQSAYADLGFPKAYFNDRLIEVIDQLLDTPESDVPLKVHLPAVTGPIQPARPWVLYEYDEPSLQALSAGQRIMLRIGPVNERRAKARLAELRKLIAAPASTHR